MKDKAHFIPGSLVSTMFYLPYRKVLVVSIVVAVKKVEKPVEMKNQNPCLQLKCIMTVNVFILSILLIRVEVTRQVNLDHYDSIIML